MTEETKKLVERNHNMIYWYCSKKNLNPNDWYDIFAVAMCEKASNYDPLKSKESTFFATILKNAYVSEIRKQKRQKRALYNTQSFGGVLEDMDNKTDSIDGMFEADAMLCFLPEPHRSIITLRLVGYSNREIAEMSSLTQKQVENYVRKAKELIKKYLEVIENEANR